MTEGPTDNQEQDYISDAQVFEAMKTGEFEIVNRWYKEQEAFTKPFGAEALIDLDIKMARFQVDAHLPDFAKVTLDSLTKKGATLTDEQASQVRELLGKLDSEHVTIEIPDDQITDAEARDSLASGENEIYMQWLAQQKKAIKEQNNDSILMNLLNVRDALAHIYASRMAQRASQQSHHDQALRILEETNSSIKRELKELQAALPNDPARAAHIETLENITKNIADLQTDIQRK